ncbi:enhancing lycopene biosynthesis protein 2 [Klebsiella pneumoniae]|nr:enhancing lycopene biosynthesis protein 2 [Klebsiella pneumoniae]
MKKIGVVLGGCGVYDGSEIHEAVITRWRSRATARRQCALRPINRSAMSSTI